MGNLTEDRHKGVSMTYNHFNKPTEVQGSGEKIVYIYSVPIAQRIGKGH
jgi:hypothetical protein